VACGLIPYLVVQMGWGL